MKQQMLSFLKEEDGVTAIEYGLIAGLIAVALLAALTPLGEHLSDLFTNIGNKVEGAATEAAK
ncbi:Flp family type IVb pilin [Castellaniella sp.]|uniref:Flp family type IVb pilin n=1 Tax=Castellaniella sp. TaxID=1955812 RepID=UPI003C742A11